MAENANNPDVERNAGTKPENEGGLNRESPGRNPSDQQSTGQREQGGQDRGGSQQGGQDRGNQGGFEKGTPGGDNR